MPVRATYELWRVPKVLLTEIISPHMCDAISIENEMKPREIFEKIHFYWLNPHIINFTLFIRGRRTFPSLLAAPEGLGTYVRWVFWGRMKRGTTLLLWSRSGKCLELEKKLVSLIVIKIMGLRRFTLIACWRSAHCNIFTIAICRPIWGQACFLLVKVSSMSSDWSGLCINCCIGID